MSTTAPNDDSPQAELSGDQDVAGRDVEWSLEIPFVTTASKGGPHDDASYTAGWEMGTLHAALEDNHSLAVERVIHSSNAAQARLIATYHGYIAHIEATGVPGWSALRLSRTGVG